MGVGNFLGYAKISTGDQDPRDQRPRPKDGVAATRTRGKRPGRRPLDADKATTALKLVQAGLGRASVYREMAHAGVRRPA